MLTLFSPCSADERFDATFHTNVLVNATGSCQYIPPGDTSTIFLIFFTLLYVSHCIMYLSSFSPTRPRHLPTNLLCVTSTFPLLTKCEMVLNLIRNSLLLFQQCLKSGSYYRTCHMLLHRGWGLGMGRSILKYQHFDIHVTHLVLINNNIMYKIRDGCQHKKNGIKETVRGVVLLFICKQKHIRMHY